MYSNKVRNKGWKNVRTLEKLSYALLIPTVCGYFGYRMYKQNVTEAAARALQVQTVEDKFSAEAKANIDLMMESLRE